ncbi:MAG: hypothetical protein R3F20_06400 [Planctomycetota bacterium]
MTGGADRHAEAGDLALDLGRERGRVEVEAREVDPLASAAGQGVEPRDDGRGEAVLDRELDLEPAPALVGEVAERELLDDVDAVLLEREVDLRVVGELDLERERRRRGASAGRVPQSQGVDQFRPPSPSIAEPESPASSPPTAGRSSSSSLMSCSPVLWR